MSNPENHAVQSSNKILTSSAVPTILVLVLIWMTAAVLLTLSVLSQRDFSILKKGDSAPFSTWALTDFSYIDKAKTNAEKAAARKSAPQYLLISVAEYNQRRIGGLLNGGIYRVQLNVIREDKRIILIRRYYIA